MNKYSVTYLIDSSNKGVVEPIKQMYTWDEALCVAETEKNKIMVHNPDTTFISLINSKSYTFCNEHGSVLVYKCILNSKPDGVIKIIYNK